MVKKLLLLLVIITQGHAFDPSQDDKIKHMSVSVATGMVGTTLCYKEFKLTAEQSWWCGIATSFFIGGLKEWYDKNTGGVADWEDMQADAVGGIIGSSLLYYQYKF